MSLPPQNFTTYGYPVTTGHFLRVDAWTSQTGITANMAYRLEVPGSPPKIETVNVPIANTNRTVNTLFQPLGTGILTGVSINSSGTPTRGQFYVTVLLKDSKQADNKFQKLIAGYLESGPNLGWPWSSPEPFLSGMGWMRSINASPAAGADISQTVPTNAQWRMGGLYAKLVASSAVATRTPKFQITDGTNILWENTPGGGTALNVTASQTRTFLLMAGNLTPETAYDSANEVRIGIPISVIQAMATGWVLKSVTGAIDVGDQWTATLPVEEWLNPVS